MAIGILNIYFDEDIKIAKQLITPYKKVFLNPQKYFENDMMSNFLILINTCKNYFDGVNELINQIEKFNFPKNKFIFISGQEDEYDIDFYRGILLIKVDYTAINLTGLLYISENPEKFSNIKYIMCLHDTIEFKVKFFNLISNYFKKHLIKSLLYDYEDYDVISFYKPKLWFPSMDMGIFHINHLIRSKDYLSKIKVRNYSQDILVSLKRILVCDENTLLGRDPVRNYGHNYDLKTKNVIHMTGNILGDLDRYCIVKNGRKLKVTYFKKLDFIKYQRHFDGNYKETLI